ncbi:MAG: hypothetical protein WCA35_26540, partial [Kovacikia sp.]
MTVILLISMAVVILVGSMQIGTVSAEVSQTQFISPSEVTQPIKLSQLALNTASPSVSPTPSASPNPKPSDSAVQKTGEPNPTCSPNGDLAWLSWPFLGGFYVLALGGVLMQLWGDEKWKLSEALSEEAAIIDKDKLTQLQKDLGSASNLNNGEKIAKVTEVIQQLEVELKKPQLVASASRLIALVGSIVLGGVLFTSSFYIVWALFNCQPMKPLSDLGSYLTACAALFAPYVANKVSD